MDKPLDSPQLGWSNNPGPLFARPAETPIAEAPAWHDDDTLATQALWEEYLAEVYTAAQTALPQVGDRLDKARELVQAGEVVYASQEHLYLVRSQTHPDRVYRVNSQCPCEDYPNAPGHWCKHLLAVALYIRTTQRMQRDQERTLAAAQETRPPTVVEKTLHPDVEAALIERYTWEGKDTRAIRYIGLLLIAKARGLTSLSARWLLNEPELSLAQATATFRDGTGFTEAGDATPQNVSKFVVPHFRRMALTRAKARALRDALGIDMVAFEELGEL